MKIPQSPIERRVWTKARLELRGSNFSVIARRLGVTVSAVSDTMMRPNERIEAEIAKDCGLEPKDLFADRYSADGIRIARTRRSKVTTDGDAGHFKKRKVG